MDMDDMAAMGMHYYSSSHARATKVGEQQDQSEQRVQVVAHGRSEMACQHSCVDEALVNLKGPIWFESLQ